MGAFSLPVVFFLLACIDLHVHCHIYIHNRLVNACIVKTTIVKTTIYVPLWKRRHCLLFSSFLIV